MNFSQQSARVELLGDRLRTHRDRAARLRAGLRGWLRTTFSPANLVSWSLAAGTLAGAQMTGGSGRRERGRAVLAVANAALLLRRFLNSPVALASDSSPGAVRPPGRHNDGRGRHAA